MMTILVIWVLLSSVGCLALALAAARSSSVPSEQFVQETESPVFASDGASAVNLPSRYAHEAAFSGH
jgi:hypothetical protein